MNGSIPSTDDAGRYAPPEADLGTGDLPPSEAGGFVMAGRGRRLAAVMIDGLLQSALVWGLLLGPLGWHFSDARRGTHLLLLMFLSVATYVLLNGWLLANRGQTIGKRLLGLRIVDRRGGPVSLLRLLGLRYLPITMAAMVPTIGVLVSLVDCLTIFRDSRRTLHDEIAGTQVVTAASSADVHAGTTAPAAA